MEEHHSMRIIPHVHKTTVSVNDEWISTSSLCELLNHIDSVVPLVLEIYVMKRKLDVATLACSLGLWLIQSSGTCLGKRSRLIGLTYELGKDIYILHHVLWFIPRGA